MARYEWLSNIKILTIIYSILVATTSTVFIFLNEVRLDVYISLYILEYYILRALFTPLPIRVDRRLRILDISYFIIFSIIVTYRVLLILAPGLVGW